MLSVSHNAQSRPASNDNRSTVVNSKRAAPVIRVQAKDGKRSRAFPPSLVFCACQTEREAVIATTKENEVLLGAGFLDDQLDENA
jgi:hypothetical protein